jgi:choline kinase
MHSESITALILCAGTGERWGDFTGSPKQLAPINNESLLQRTVRLLKSRKIDSIHIISHDERLRLEGCHFFRPENSRWTAETLSSTRELWTERTLILLGDVFFSEKAMDCITGFEGRAPTDSPAIAVRNFLP